MVGTTPVVSPAPAEGSEEEERQVKGLYESMQALFAGVDDVVTCKTVAIFMAALMISADNWKAVIGGFMNHMSMGANVALTHHRKQEQTNGNEESKAGEESKPAEEAKG